MSTLFEEQDAAEVKAKPATADPVQPPDFYNLYIPTIANVPEGWRWYELDCHLGSAPKGFTKVTGAVAPLKADGQPNWRKEDKATKAVVFIDQAKFKAWIEEYAKSLGKCPKCWNSGLVMDGWNQDTGKRWKPCECASPARPAAGEKERGE